MGTTVTVPGEDIQTTIVPRSEAPVESDGSFFICDRSTYPQHAELVDLVDPDTGLPYPLAPTERNLPLNNGNKANWHHSVHPHDHAVLHTLGGRAMRSAQIQLVTPEQHNRGSEAFHNLEVGPFIMREIGHQLGMCVVAAAGYKHRRGLETRGGELWVRPLTERQQHTLTLPANPERFEPWQAAIYGKFYGIETQEAAEEDVARLYRERAAMRYRNVRYGYEPIRNFVISLMFRQNLSNVDGRVRKSFLQRCDDEKGLDLMAIALEELAASSTTYNGQTLKDLYRDLYKAGRLNPSMPSRVSELLEHKTGNIQSRRQLVPAFHARLSSSDEAA